MRPQTRSSCRVRVLTAPDMPLGSRRAPLRTRRAHLLGAGHPAAAAVGGQEVPRHRQGLQEHHAPGHVPPLASTQPPKSQRVVTGCSAIVLRHTRPRAVSIPLPPPPQPATLPCCPPLPAPPPRPPFLHGRVRTPARPKSKARTTRLCRPRRKRPATGLLSRRAAPCNGPSESPGGACGRHRTTPTVSASGPSPALPTSSGGTGPTGGVLEIRHSRSRGSACHRLFRK